LIDARVSTVLHDAHDRSVIANPVTQRVRIRQKPLHKRFIHYYDRKRGRSVGVGEVPAFENWDSEHMEVTRTDVVAPHDGLRAKFRQEIDSVHGVVIVVTPTGAEAIFHDRRGFHAW